MSDELSGRTLGRYQVLERLGRGGMAEVYRAYQPSLDRFVAIKVIYPHLAGDPGLRERFGREARAVAALHHPNIVQVHDFDVQGDVAFMAMEFVSGPTLKHAIASLGQRGRLLPLPVAGQIVGQIAEALAYAHEQGVVHRDVKPANVLLRRRGRADPAAGSRELPPLSDEALDELLLTLGPGSVVLTDFGVARVISDSVEQTAAGTILGSPAYMAPEQGRGERADARSDIYALGVVLYELITGRVPFDADTPFAIVIKHSQAPLPPPRSFRPDLPEQLERVLLKALAKEPADRFQDAGAFGAAVREAAGPLERSALRLTEAPSIRPVDTLPARETRVVATTAIPGERPQQGGAPSAPGEPPQQGGITAAPAPPAARPRLGRRLLGCLLGLLALGAVAVAAFAAGGLAVFRGLGQAGALVVPTQLSAQATAAAERGEPFPYIGEGATPTEPPAAVAAALAEARAACAAPGCPGGNASAAIAVLDQAIEAQPDSAELAAARARTYLWWDPYTYAEQIAADIETALALDPNSVVAHLARGDAARILGDPEQALAAYTRAIELDPAATEAYLGRAALLFEAPDFYEDVSPSRDQAIADTTAALALNPENVEALVLRGEALANGRQPDEAYADFTAALALDPANYRALMRRGDLSRYTYNDPQAALADYGAAVEAYPENLDARRSRASLLAEQGEYAAARPDADTIVALDAANPDSYRFRGFLALAAGALEPAAADFDYALTIAGPDDLAARYGRGAVLLAQDDPASALPDLEAAAADVDNLDVAWHTFFGGRRRIYIDLAHAYNALGRPEDALAALDRAIELDSDWYLPYLVRGRLRAATADSAGARADLRQALELVGDGPERAEVEQELRQLP
ncbi:MAG: serine/threonine-protein kinase [Chloroflexi bacterium OHK40]